MKMRLIILLMLIGAVSVTAQNRDNKRLSKDEIDCIFCHKCDTPTKIEPCLIHCPRNTIIKIYHSPEEAPENIEINKFGNALDLYSPVDFSHKSHAAMSEMNGGCSSCHHYTPKGRITPCSECHEIQRKRDDLSKPDLKAAYHRECVNCHSKWSHELKCRSCHKLNNIKEKREEKFFEKYKIEEPKILIFHTSDEDIPIVTFFHSLHSNLTKLECYDCHKNVKCEKCHDVNKPEKFEFKKPATPHETCAGCHDTERKCELCHSAKAREKFDHYEQTGFSLAKYHEKLSCEKCHGKSKKVIKIDERCNSCHKNWSFKNFNHSIVGVYLDEIHSSFYCENCHINRNFSAKPVCSDCHDDKYTYPEYLPGEKK